MKKKILCVLFVGLIILSVFPLSIFATSSETTNEWKNLAETTIEHDFEFVFAGHYKIEDYGEVKSIQTMNLIAVMESRGGEYNYPELYLYIYNPSRIEIDKKSDYNNLHLSVYNGANDTNKDNYEKRQIELVQTYGDTLNKELSTNALILKYRLPNVSTYSASGTHCYNFVEFELLKTGAETAQNYLVAKKYSFTYKTVDETNYTYVTCDEDSINVLQTDAYHTSMTYNDDLVVYHLFDVLMDYAQLYLIYICECSYIFGNLSVREDMFCDNGYLPMWNTDFFHRDPYESAMTSRFAKIFDYDMFRLGKKMVEDNKNSGAFEFGVVILTEIGKERKNNLENRENKKKSDECNQNNDLFNTTLKMIRHRATVCFFSFVRIITDEQRPESWGADARDLCSVMELGESSDIIILYRGLFFDGFIHDIIYPKFKNFYLEMRDLRGDNTLLVYLMKNILGLLENRHDKLQNRFGYYQLPVTTRSGNLEDGGKQTVYYVSCKKTYSGRFATDSHADIFQTMALRSGIGLFDFVEYQDIRQTEDEMKLQNSYFYLDMSKWSRV